MKYRRCGGLPQSIKQVLGLRKRESGKITWVLGLFLLIFIMLLAVTELQILKFRAASDLVSDALAAGGLASELIDIERYGTDHSVIISDVNAAYAVYRNVLPVNLGLDDTEYSENSGYGDGSEYSDDSGNEKNGKQSGTLICGPIVIEKFIVYNVEGGVVEAVSVDDGGVQNRSVGILGEVFAPNGKAVHGTGIYSEISFGVKGLFGAVYRADKGKLVEIKTVTEEYSEEGYSEEGYSEEEYAVGQK